MENNSNKCGNGHINGFISNSLEELIIPERLCDFARKKVGNNLFRGLKERLGYSIEKPADRKVLYLLLNGENEEENKAKLDEILDELKGVEDHFRECDETERFNVDFKLIHRMLIPSQKCGFVVGSGFELLKRIRDDCDLMKAYLDNGKKTEPIPEGYGRLIMSSQNVEGLRQARSEIGQLLRVALDNPRGPPANGKKLSGDGNLRESIKIPADLNPKQKEKCKQILEESGIEYKEIWNEWIELSGKQEKVTEIKGQLASAMNSMVRFETPQKWEHCAQILVPFPNFRYVLGQNGGKIKELQANFGVKLIFRGDNNGEYPNGRFLEIMGATEGTVAEAKAHIAENYCMEQNNRSWPNRERGESAEVQKEMTLPELVARKMLKMKIRHRLSSYEVIRRFQDGTQRVLIKGNRLAVEAAEAELEAHWKELNKNGGKWPKEGGDSSKSGSEGTGGESQMDNEGGEPNPCWIMPKEEKENDGPEIAMEGEKEEGEEGQQKGKKKTMDEWFDCVVNEKAEKQEISTFSVDPDFDLEDEEEEEEEEELDEEEEEEDEEEEEEDEKEENDEDDKEENGMKGMDGENGASNLFEMLLAQMGTMKEITEKAFQEMKKKEREKNAHIRRLEKRILTLEQRLLASEGQKSDEE